MAKKKARRARKKTTRRKAKPRPTPPPRRAPDVLAVELDHEHQEALERLGGEPAAVVRHLIIKAGGKGRAVHSEHSETDG